MPPDPPERTPWWFIHLPVEATGLADARSLADQVAGLAAASHPEIVAAAVTVSLGDDGLPRHRVYCDRRVYGSDRRCGLFAGHDEVCRPRVEL